MKPQATPAAAPALGRPWRDRFPGPDPRPHAAGSRLELREGLRVLGFWPAEWAARLPCRAVGPEPEAVLFLGAVAPEVRALRLVFLAPADPAPFGPLQVFYQDRPLATEPVPPPEAVAALVPAAWAIRAAMPAVEEQLRPAWGRLEIRFRRTLPDAGHVRWMGPALHAVEFLD